MDEEEGLLQNQQECDRLCKIVENEGHDTGEKFWIRADDDKFHMLDEEEFGDFSYL